MISSKSFSVAHYSGTVSYQLRDVLAKNRDFLAAEIVETMRASKDVAIKDLFTNRLTKSGNLTVCRDKALMAKTKNNKIGRWGAALMAEKTPIRVRVPKALDNEPNLLLFIQPNFSSAVTNRSERFAPRTGRFDRTSGWKRSR